jgi:hypothetical protein
MVHETLVVIGSVLVIWSVVAAVVVLVALRFTKEDSPHVDDKNLVAPPADADVSAPVAAGAVRDAPRADLRGVPGLRVDVPRVGPGADPGRWAGNYAGPKASLQHQRIAPRVAAPGVLGLRRRRNGNGSPPAA